MTNAFIPMGGIITLESFMSTNIIYIAKLRAIITLKFKLIIFWRLLNETFTFTMRSCF